MKGTRPGGPDGSLPAAAGWVRRELAKVDTQAALSQPVPERPAEAPVSPPPAGLDVPALAGEGIDPDEKAPRSFHLSRQVLERARAAAQYLSGLPGAEGPTTISELVERALRRELERLEREHNGGLPFPAVRGRMRTGPGAAGAERIRRAQRARHRATDDG
jgi:hypothetical protein